MEGELDPQPSPVPLQYLISQAGTLAGTDDNPEQPVPNDMCTDWMVVGGWCHYARDRASFIDYVPVGRELDNFPGGQTKTYVAGHGAVELRVKPMPGEERYHRVLVLEDVLHIPDAVCNGFQWMMYHKASGGTTDAKVGYNENHQRLWCSEEYCGHRRLVLARDLQKRGKSYLHPGGYYSRQGSLSRYVCWGNKEDIPPESDVDISISLD